MSDFRCFERLDFDIGGQSVYLYGQNGAGKTNILEAISVLNPGRGLRGAAFAELGRKCESKTQGKPWGVALKLKSEDDELSMGTGSDPRDLTKRLVRIDGVSVPAQRLLDSLRIVWLTPSQDRILVEARSERLRFFDRLVYAAEPEHASTISAYEKSLRERLKLLIHGPMDVEWLGVLEQRLVQSGCLMIAARRRAMKNLQARIDNHHGAFPKADLSLSGEAEHIGDEAALMGFLSEGYKRSRARDAAASRSLFGPHRTDLNVFHRDKNRPASECSTGEQKSLILNMILAQGARLSLGIDDKGLGENSSTSPILLLDEVAAHLDLTRRHALFDETTHLGLQTFFTGTDFNLFDGLKGRALGVHVEAGQLIEFI